MIAEKHESATFATVNPCRLCAPLGASLAFKGIAGAISLIHGSQGCATYIRRYIISHFREPVDIASSSFTEDTAIFGGGENLKQAILNVTNRYAPALIGITSTCLSETIGDDVSLWLRQLAAEYAGSKLPSIVHVATPSYKGSHESGYHGAIAAIVNGLTRKRTETNEVFLIPPLLSPADLRALGATCAMFGLQVNLLPDISDALDGGTWRRYHPLPPGGTPLDVIKRIGGARAVIELGAGAALQAAGSLLQSEWGRRVVRTPLPVGIRATDRFLAVLSGLADRRVPAALAAQRSRAADAYVDGHKYVFEKRVVLFGDEDTVAALAGFCADIGMLPVLCATSGQVSRLRETLAEAFPAERLDQVAIIEESDFDIIERHASEMQPDLCIGTSKGYPLANRLGIPLVRAGFPIHDRFGAGRMRMTGYDGSMELFDRIVNAILRRKQDSGDIAYSYM